VGRGEKHSLVVVVYATDAGADGGEDFVGDGAELVGEDGDGEVVAEDFYAVAFMTVDIRDVYHGYVHADVAYVWRLLSVDETVGVSVAQTPVEPVGIAYGDGCDAAVAIEGGAA